MTITIKTRRLRVNKLLARKELLLDVYHEGKPNVSQKDLKELIANKYKCEIKNLVLFGFRTAFGGNRSTGFCLSYDNQQYLVKYESSKICSKPVLILCLLRVWTSVLNAMITISFCQSFLLCTIPKLYLPFYC